MGFEILNTKIIFVGIISQILMDQVSFVVHEHLRHFVCIPAYAAGAYTPVDIDKKLCFKFISKANAGNESLFGIRIYLP